MIDEAQKSAVGMQPVQMPEFERVRQEMAEHLVMAHDQISRLEGTVALITGVDAPPCNEGLAEYPSGIVGSLQFLKERTTTAWGRLQEINNRLEEVF